MDVHLPPREEGQAARGLGFTGQATLGATAHAGSPSGGSSAEQPRHATLRAEQDGARFERRREGRAGGFGSEGQWSLSARPFSPATPPVPSPRRLNPHRRARLTFAFVSLRRASRSLPPRCRLDPPAKGSRKRSRPEVSGEEDGRPSRSRLSRCATGTEQADCSRFSPSAARRSETRPERLRYSRRLPPEPPLTLRLWPLSRSGNTASGGDYRRCARDRPA